MPIATPLGHRGGRHRLVPAPFVGRDQEMEQMGAAVHGVLAGCGRLLLVLGDPGIGKTRMGQEAAMHARERGLRVLWGRCHETGGAPAYWPWIQVLREVVQACAPDELRTLLGSGATDVAQVITEVRERLPDLPSPPALEPEQARFRLFDGITGFLKRAAKRQPLMLIFDDLQRSDTPSVRVLEFLVRELVDVPLLVVGTYRDIEVPPEHPLFATLGELGREPSTQRMALRGLSEEHVGRYIALTAGVEPSHALVRAVFEETQGNPLFVGEVVRVLAAEGRLVGSAGERPGRPTIPPSIHEVIARQLQRLSPNCFELLTVAAVLGREFGLNVLERALACEVLPALDEAIDAHLIQTTEATGRYRFVHVLIREVLYQQLGTAERMRWHRQIGETLEALYQVYPEPYFTELAYHFVSAVPGGARNKAIDYAVKAGNRAAAQMAHEEAARHYEMALQVLELTESGDGTQLCEVLLLLSEARWRAGEYEKARDVSLRATEIARRLGAAEFMARGALGFAGPFVAFGVLVTDDMVIALLEETLSTLRPEDSPLRARLLARLAEELTLTDADERRWKLCFDAVEMARRIGDRSLLATVLKSVYFASWVPQDVEGRLAVAEEIAQLAVEIGDRALEVEGHILRVWAFMELGDSAAVQDTLRVCDRLARELRQPYHRWYLGTARVVLAFMEGRLAEVESLAQETLQLGQEVKNTNAGIIFAIQLGHLFYNDGRLDDVALMVTGLSETSPLLQPVRGRVAHTMRCALVATYAEQGDVAKTRGEFDRFAANDFSDLRLCLTWMYDVCALALGCVLLEDRRSAQRLYDLLLPTEARNVVMTACFTLGSSSLFLGLLAATMGRQREAARHFEDALAMNERMGTKQWLAHTQVAYADLLLTRHTPENGARASALLEAADEIANEFRLPQVAASVAAVRARAKGATITDRAPGPALAAKPAEGILRREGEFWTIVYTGTVSRLKDAKGLHYIAHLLRHPGREFHTIELLAATADVPRRDPERSTSIVDGGARVLPETGAPAAALGSGDLSPRKERAGVAKDGETSSPTERARLAVTKRIKTAIKRIADCDPRLGRYLATRVHTGYLCVYRPDPEHPIRWEL